MTDSEKIDFLGGQVDALLAFSSAVMKSHPNLDALKAMYDESSEWQTAGALGASVSERFIEGQNQTKERLRQFLIAAALRRAS